MSRACVAIAPASYQPGLALPAALLGCLVGCVAGTNLERFRRRRKSVAGAKATDDWINELQLSKLAAAGATTATPLKSTTQRCEGGDGATRRVGRTKGAETPTPSQSSFSQADPRQEEVQFGGFSAAPAAPPSRPSDAFESLWQSAAQDVRRSSTSCTT